MTKISNNRKMEKIGENNFLHFVVYHKGNLIIHNFKAQMNSRLLASITIDKNLKDYLMSKWPKKWPNQYVDEGELEGIFVMSFPKEGINSMSKLTSSDLYGCEMCSNKLKELYKQGKVIVSPFRLGAGGYTTLDYWLSETE